LSDSVRAVVNIQLLVTIRPRGGNFVYSDLELAVMRKDILNSKTCGVDGVVLGVLTRDDVVDRAHTQELVELARPLQVTFHRALDVCRDLDRALEDVVACGADRVLTSGGKVDDVKGMIAIARLQQRAANRIRIMAGGGIRISNVRLVALRTGICEVHTSLNTQEQSSGTTRFLVRENDVRAFKSALLAIHVKDSAGTHVQ
jgi:copper homeostasis protein